MKPKDLKAPFSWNERRPLIKDNVFYVPDYYRNHAAFSFPSWEIIFGNSNRVAVEYCAGNGDWIAGRALEFPEINWVAVEMRFDRVRKIWSKMKNFGQRNLLIVSGEGRTFTTHYIPKDSVAEVYINFPDPWPKGRHAKHRLIKDDFLDALAHILKSEGSVTFVSDDPSYRDETLTYFSNHSQFFSASAPPYYSQTLDGYGNSWFEKLWRNKGKRIYYTQWLRT